MKIAVVGSTGRTGLEIVQQALDAGHDVRALARTPSKMSLQHARLETREFDILTSSIEDALDGIEAVIVSLGGAELKDSSTRSEGTRRLVAAMRERGVPRIIVVSTAGVGDSFEQLSPRGQEVVRTVIKEAVEDHGRQEKLVRESTLQWTIARPGGLGTGPQGEYKADPTGSILIGGVDRANVAHFTIRALTDASTIGQVFGLSNS